MFTKKGGGDMLEKDVLLEISLADRLIKNITINDEGVDIGYSEICGRVGEKCFENPIIEILPDIDNIVQRKKKLKYPIDIDPLTYSYQIYSLNFGNVIEDENDVIQTVNAMRLTYFTDESDEKKQNVIERWRTEVYNRIRYHRFKHVLCFIDYTWSIEQQNVQLMDNIKPMIGALVAFISVFTTVTYISNNWAKSKPFLGVASVVSAGLAVITSFGFMSVVGVQNSIWNITIPFLVLVTEIDDAFVLLACWRISNPKHKVHKRMEETLGEAGISITLTSLTNLFSYYIGMMSSFPLIRIFCYYSATSIVFTFLYQITFFAGCMALSGYREEKQQQEQALRVNFGHEETLNKGVIKMPIRKLKLNHLFYHRSSVIPNASIRQLPSGVIIGLVSNTAFNRKDIEHSSTEDEMSTDEPTMSCFRDKLGKILSINVVKLIVIIVYFLNLSFGIWGALTIKHGIEFTKLYPKQSVITQGIKIYYNSFGRYTFPYQIIINSTLDYSDLNVQKSVDELLNKFESLPYIADSRLTVSWLKYYKEFQNHPLAKYLLRGYNMSVKQDFLDGLRNVFLKFKSAEQFSNDIAFNSDGSDIISSRFHILVNDTLSPAAEIEMLKNMWKNADEFDFPVLVYSAVAPLYEQGIIIGRTINELFWITSLLVMILFVVIIPNIVVAVLVAISVSSTIVETLGYMSLWDKINSYVEMNVDTISDNYEHQCHICKKGFNYDDIRVRDYNHLTGNYCGIAHNHCYDSHQIIKNIPPKLFSRIQIIPINQKNLQRLL
ncbi:patched domain-containing protein 1-like [Centruroides sculpturatus]|uniref:patched domain-containing protein 1-like n=1 Tax=Centruroides sculpturatus TaxID=218467 RepID=UPI000C6E62A1|nr:patched domain-containing protein 1-like [Centruroides sculpturatus]